jgi:hypothetical protein
MDPMGIPISICFFGNNSTNRFNQLWLKSPWPLNPSPLIIMVPRKLPFMGGHPPAKDATGSTAEALISPHILHSYYTYVMYHVNDKTKTCDQLLWWFHSIIFPHCNHIGVPSGSVASFSAWFRFILNMLVSLEHETKNMFETTIAMARNASCKY